MHQFGGWTYMLASKRNGTLYTGATSDLFRHVSLHRDGMASHFTRKHEVTALVWYEQHSHVQLAMRRRDLISRWRRKWKLALIERNNPEWIDLFCVIEALPTVPEWVQKCAHP
ncbi:MAG: GIY-YIG nuclease family protein [Micropepsaceae bacterium]